MSARLSVQTLLLADGLAQELMLKNKGDLDKALLVQSLLEKIRKKEVPEQMLEPDHLCHVVANKYFHQHTMIRRRCEQQGDLFRPQMLIPVAPGVLTRFGTGGFLAAVGYQKETNKKIQGAVKIIERAATISNHCNTLAGHLVKHPKWNITRVETELLGYRWRSEDDQPFPIIFDFDDEDDEGGAT